jgi:hypothetical protein
MTQLNMPHGPVTVGAPDSGKREQQKTPIAETVSIKGSESMPISKQDHVREF